MRQSRGLTLIETLIVMGLSFLLLVMIHRLLTPLLGTSRATTIGAYQSQQAHLFMSRFSKDLKEAKSGSLSYLDESVGKVLAISKPERLTDSGSAISEPQLIIYRWVPETEKVERFFLKPGDPLWPSDFDPSRPVRLGEVTLRGLAGSLHQAKVLASHVTEFEPFEEWPIRSVVKCSIKLSERPPGQNRLQEFSLSNQISLRQ